MDRMIFCIVFAGKLLVDKLHSQLTMELGRTQHLKKLGSWL